MERLHNMAKFDLDILMPESDEISFSVQGEKYTLPVKISFAVGVYLIENMEIIKEVMPVQFVNGEAKLKPKLSAKTLQVVSKVIKVMMIENYPEITDEWIVKNISLPRMGLIVMRSVIPIINYFNSIDLSLIDTNEKK